VQNSIKIAEEKQERKIEQVSVKRDGEREIHKNMTIFHAALISRKNLPMYE
jgi:hypothetical protein